MGAISGKTGRARITLIDPRGTVLADSQHDPETMENHAGRPEIRDARQGTHRQRHSAQRHHQPRSVLRGVPDSREGQPGFVLRLAVPLDELDTAIAAVRWRILGASLVAAILALILAYYFSGRFTSRIRRLQAFAEKLPEGGFSPDAVMKEGDDELGALADSLTAHGRADRRPCRSAERGIGPPGSNPGQHGGRRARGGTGPPRDVLQQLFRPRRGCAHAGTGPDAARSTGARSGPGRRSSSTCWNRANR